MSTGAITEYMDVAQVTLYVFWIFFAGLILYLRREDTREGYPLETDTQGEVRRKNFIFYPAPVEYRLSHGDGSVFLPNDGRDAREVRATRVAPWPGSAYVPSGDPMHDGVGPAAWAERKKQVEQTHAGEQLIVPLRIATDFSCAPSFLSRDPRGYSVRGADGATAGTVADVWVDRAEHMARHLELELTSGKHVILPLAFARVGLDSRTVKVQAINGAQFESVPALEHPDTLTTYEEERIQSFYGGGYLYADPKRAEPLV